MLNYVRVFDFPEKMDLIPILTDDLLDDFLKSADAKQLQILSVRKTGKYKKRLQYVKSTTRSLYYVVAQQKYAYEFVSFYFSMLR